MKKTNILILGLGKIGSAVLHFLSKNADEYNIYTFDKPSVLNSIENDSIIRVTNERYLNENMYEMDLVICTLPSEHVLRWCKRAACNSVPWIDINHVDSIVEEQKKLCSNAEIIPRCGLAPGLTGILAYYLFNRNRKTNSHIDSLMVFCGGISEKPDNMFGWVNTWSSEGLYDEYTLPVKTKKGKIIYNDKSTVELFFNRSINFEEFYNVRILKNEYQFVPTHGGEGNLIDLLGKNLHFFSYNTLRHHRHYELALALAKCCTKEEFCYIIEKNATKGKDKVVISIEVGYENYSGEFFGEEDGSLTAMQRMTALPVFAIAKMILTDKIKANGFFPVETIDFNEFDIILKNEGLDLGV